MTSLSPTDHYNTLSDCLRRAQEAAASISHLRGMDGDRASAEQWLTVSENFKIVQTTVRMMYIGSKR